MRALDHTDLSQFNRVDWKRSTQRLSQMVSEQANRDWEFEAHFDEDGSVGFSARAGGEEASNSDEQTRLHEEDQQVIRDVFESFDWVAYR